MTVTPPQSTLAMSSPIFMKSLASFLVSTILLGASATAQTIPAAVSPNAQQGGQGQGQGQQVQAPIPEFAALKAVPHGAIHVVWYDSKTFSTQRRLHVYTPPGYERGRTKYPVLYLFPGAGQDDATWTDGNRLQFVMDNLLATDKIKPMIVVMPAPGGPGPGGDNSPEGLAARAAGANKSRVAIIDDMLGTMIPYVESAYRVQNNRESRAVAGFSFGGADSIWLGTGHLNQFAWIATFAMGIQGGSTAPINAIAGSGVAGTPAEFVKDNAGFFADSKKTNELLRLFFVGVGKDDNIVANGPKQLSDTLTAHGIDNEYHQIEGGHNNSTARLLMWEFVQKLFR